MLRQFIFTRLLADIRERNTEVYLIKRQKASDQQKKKKNQQKKATTTKKKKKKSVFCAAVGQLSISQVLPN